MLNHLLEINYKQHILGIVLFATSIICVSITSYQFYEAYQTLQTQEQQLKTQYLTNDQTNQDLTQFVTNYELFKKHQKIGIIGLPQRLHWVEVIESVSKLYDIPSVDFALENLRISDPLEDYYEINNEKFESTTMTLNIQALHEMDVFNLLTQMHKRAHGVFSTDYCEMFLVNEGSYSGMQAMCELTWYQLYDFTQDWENKDVNLTQIREKLL